AGAILGADGGVGAALPASISPKRRFQRGDRMRIVRSVEIHQPAAIVGLAAGIAQGLGAVELLQRLLLVRHGSELPGVSQAQVKAGIRTGPSSSPPPPPPHPHPRPPPP